MPSPCTVTATLQTADDQALQGNAFIRFRLRNFSGFVPRIIGTSVIAETQVDEFPNGSGVVSATLWGNDKIDPSNTFYTVEWWNGGRITSQGNFSIIGTTFDLDSAAQLNPPSQPSPVTSLTQIVLQTNGVNNGSQIKFNAVAGTGMAITDDGLGNITFATSGGSPGSPIDGDVLRWSEFDGLYEKDFVWDWKIIPSGGSALPQIYETGPWALTAGSGSLGSNGAGTLVNDTALPSGTLYTSNAAGNPAFAGWNFNGVSTIPFNQIRRVRVFMALSQLTSTRVFFGVGPQVNGISFTTDVLNQNFVGFRFSSTTDTNFMAYCGTSNVAATVVSTGVAADTNIHQFDFVYLPNNKVLFYIDRVLVATITTNLPASTVVANPICYLDNKAGGVAKSFVFYGMKGSVPRNYR